MTTTGCRAVMTRPVLRPTLMLLVSLLALGAGGRGAWAQAARNPAAMTSTAEAVTASTPQSPVDFQNPLSVLKQVEQMMPRDPAGTGSGDRQGLSATLSILLLLTVLTVAPSLLIMTTSFTRVVVVLALLRQAIGTQSLPPSQVIIGLSLFITLLVMMPTFNQINEQAIVPMNAGEIEQTEAWKLAKTPLKDFMIAQVDYADNWQDVYMVLQYRYGEAFVANPSELTFDDVDMLTLIPAFVLSELKVAFLIGFRLYLPFLIIDMVVASVLISMGMLMLPPVLVSLPFKLLLFVLVDGWHLVVGNLLSGFALPGITT